MSKNFRREGQPEKERISQATGIELDKVSCKLSNFTGVSFIYIFTSNIQARAKIYSRNRIHDPNANYITLFRPPSNSTLFVRLVAVKALPTGC